MKVQIMQLTPHQRETNLDEGFEAGLPLFYVAESLVSRLEHREPSLRLAIHSLENYVNALTIQRHRIDEDHISASDLYDTLEISPDDEDKLTAELRVAMIFLDLHYYFICLDKIKKLFRLSLSALGKVARNGPNTDVIRVKRRAAKAALNEALRSLGSARDFLEHLDNEIAAGHHRGFEVNITSSSLEFTYGSPPDAFTVDIGNILYVYKAYEALVEYSETLPA